MWKVHDDDNDDDDDDECKFVDLLWSLLKLLSGKLTFYEVDRLSS